MARISIIALLVLAAAVMIKSNTADESKQAKPIKLSGFAISKPKAKVESQQLKQAGQSRRSISSGPAKVQPQISAPAPAQEQRVPIQALEPEQKISRAKQAWENIKVKALDRLRVDQSTRERIEELRDEYYQSPSSLKYSEYVRSVRDLLGDENYTFLYNAREEFKARVYDRAQIEIGPHLGEL